MTLHWAGYCRRSLDPSGTKKAKQAKTHMADNVSNLFGAAVTTEAGQDGNQGFYYRKLLENFRYHSTHTRLYIRLW